MQMHPPIYELPDAFSPPDRASSVYPETALVPLLPDGLRAYAVSSRSAHPYLLFVIASTVPSDTCAASVSRTFGHVAHHLSGPSRRC